MVYNDVLKKEIPVGWNQSKLGEISSFKNGINYDKEEQGNASYKIVNVRNITSSSLYINNNDLDEIILNQKNADKYIINSNDILIARSGTPGAIRLIDLQFANTIFCGFIITCSPVQDYNKYFIAYYLKSFEGTNATKTGGSILQNVSQETLKNLKLVVPTQNELKLFNEYISLVHEKISSLSQEINMLIHLRDWLLPMLMNGQVTVEE